MGSSDNMTLPSQNSSADNLTGAVNDNSLAAISPPKQYVFTPAGFHVKLTFSVLIVVAAVVGFAGNLCVLLFTNNEEKKPVRARSSNLNFFIRSLALSDVLSCIIGAPLIVIGLNFDLFSTKWPCIVSRYFMMVFIAITIYNLVVVSVERYICTCRPTSRPLSLRAVRKAVKGAWLLGLLLTLVFSYPVEVVRIDLSSTHYTMICGYNHTSRTARIIRAIKLLSTFILPSIILVCTCACIIRMLWKRNRSIGNASSGNSRATAVWRISCRKATIQLTAMIIAFVVPHFLVIASNIVRLLSPLTIDFKTEYTIRAATMLIVYLNSPVNFVIHLMQLTNFRKTVKSFVVCCEKGPQMDPVQAIRLSPIPKPAVAPVCRAQFCE